MKCRLKFGSFFRIGSALILGFSSGLMGCAREPAAAPGKAAPTVTVSYPLPRDITDYQDFTGRTAAVDSVLVQARITGYLDKVYFTEGTEVTEGTVLYEIDSRQYRASYDAAKAQVAANEATLQLARANNQRYKNIFKLNPGAVSHQDLDTYQSQEDQAIANLDTARANLESAKLNLDWTKIRAPVTGVIGRLLVTRGNLINANQTTLTTIVSQDPMWIYFDIDEPTALQLGELARQGKFGPATNGPPKIPFHFQLANEKGFPHQAILDLVNNQLDQATATLFVRAAFPNPKPANGPRVFAPNNFVRVRVPTSPTYQALLVNAEAVGTDQGLKYVLAVGEDNKVVRRVVKLGSLHDGLQVVLDGIKPEDRVVVSGLQRAQPGATVNPRLVAMPVPVAGSSTPLALMIPDPLPQN